MDAIGGRRKYAPPYERVMQRVVQSGECLLYVGSTNGRGGYGRLNVGKRKVSAARVVMEHHHGQSDLQVLHSCDTPACVEITHLRYGTQKENVQDMIKRGRRGDHWANRTGYRTRGL